MGDEGTASVKQDTPAGTPAPEGDKPEASEQAAVLSKRGSARGSLKGSIAGTAAAAEDDKKEKRMSQAFPGQLSATMRSDGGVESVRKASRVPTEKPPSRKNSFGGSAAGLPPKSPLVPQGTAQPVPVTRQHTENVAALDASVANVESALAAGVLSFGAGAAADAPPEGSQLGRSQSKQSLSQSVKRMPSGGSAAGLGSRQGSFAKPGSQAGGMSRRESKMSVRSPPAQELAPGEEPEPMEWALASGLAAAPAPAAEEPDEFEGVDFRMNWMMARKEVEKLNETVKQQKQDLGAANGKVAELNQEIDNLNQRASILVRQGSNGSQNAAIHDQLRMKDHKIRELEAKVKQAPRRGSDIGKTPSDPGKDQSREVSSLRDKLDRAERENERLSASLREAAEFRNAAFTLQTQVQERDQEIQQRTIAIQQLQGKLDSAQEAIVSATDYGWENDIKLAQARRALMSILDQHSPERVGRILAGDEKVGGRAPSQEQQRMAEIEREVEKLNARKAVAVEAEDYGLAGEIQGRLQNLHAEAASLEPRAAVSPSSAGGHYLRTRGAAG